MRLDVRLGGITGTAVAAGLHLAGRPAGACPLIVSVLIATGHGQSDLDAAIAAVCQ